MQIDFGVAHRIEGSDRAQRLAEATADGFKAAGISDMGDMLRELVADAIEGGDTAAAMDLARQGFSRLQKIKHPLPATVDLLQG